MSGILPSQQTASAPSQATKTVAATVLKSNDTELLSNKTNKTAKKSRQKAAATASLLGNTDKL